MQEDRRRIVGAAGGVMFLAGCASNIGHIESAPREAVPKTRAFDATFERTWSAAQRTLAEDETIKVLDRSSKLMVTEWRTIDAKELSLVESYFLGKTYKNSYTITFDSLTSNRTDVRVGVKLQAVQIAILSREESNEAVESYLRKKFFDRLSVALRSA